MPRNPRGKIPGDEDLLPVQNDGSPRHGRVGQELLSPERVAQHDRAPAGRFDIRLAKESSACRDRVQDLEEVFGDHRCGDELVLAARVDQRAAALESGDSGERLRGGADVQKIRIRAVALRDDAFARRIAGEETQEPLRLRHGHRPEPDLIDQREDGDIGADAESERQDGDAREARALDEDPHRRFQVLQHLGLIVRSIQYIYCLKAHSLRRASMGSVRAARRAGRNEVRTQTARRKTGTAPKTSRSRGRTS